jgi:hypothetical protein
MVADSHGHASRLSVAIFTTGNTTLQQIFSNAPLPLISLSGSMDSQVALKVPVPRLPDRVVELERSKKRVDKRGSAVRSNCRMRCCSTRRAISPLETRADVRG